MGELDQAAEELAIEEEKQALKSAKRGAENEDGDWVKFHFTSKDGNGSYGSGWRHKLGWEVFRYKIMNYRIPVWFVSIIKRASAEDEQGDFRYVMRGLDRNDADKAIIKIKHVIEAHLGESPKQISSYLSFKLEEFEREVKTKYEYAPGRGEGVFHPYANR